MIILRNVTKKFRSAQASRTILDRVSLTIPDGARVALIGRNGAGKSTLLKLIAGISRPDGGRIKRTTEVSWPLGFSGSFHPALTGAQNVRFVARVYGRDTTELSRYVEDFAELGDYFHMPVQMYSSGMRARLAFGVSMGVSFDCYLIDEITSVGDAAFRQRAQDELNGRLETADLIMASHVPSSLRQFCNSGIVLENGTLRYFDDLEHAISAHAETISA